MNLFNTYVRSRLEYGSQVWNPHFQIDIDTIERVQRSFTKRIPGLSDLSYPDRLRSVSTLTLEERRQIADLVLVYKILNHLVDLNFYPISFSGYPVILASISIRLILK